MLQAASTVTWPSSAEGHVLQAAICRGILILLADRTTEQVHLDVARFGGILFGGQALSQIGIDRTQQSDRERPRRPEPGACRDVRHTHQLDRGSDRMEAKGLPDDRMLDVIDAFARVRGWST